MLDIEYKGGNSVIIKTKNTTVVVDPKRSVFGDKDITDKDVVELATEPRLAVNNDKARIALEGPGEYEVADFSVKGIAAQRHIDDDSALPASTIYRIEANDIKLAVIGNVAAPLSEEQLESIGVVDIVILPVGGGGYTLDATAAVAVVRNIDPKVVIPVHYAQAGLSYEVPQSGVDAFESEIGVTIEKLDKYRLKTASGLPESLTVIELERTK